MTQCPLCGFSNGHHTNCARWPNWASDRIDKLEAALDIIAEAWSRSLNDEDFVYRIHKIGEHRGQDVFTSLEARNQRQTY